ncbi:MAG TPA: BREX-1 system adenine-specific DNA-methyltransferase PglX [Pseudomonas sp.]|jgi:hypothetical protein
MAFDQSTRGRLQKLVNTCRSLLSDEFSIQLQQTYGLDPKTGEVTSMARLTHLDDRQRHTAEVLRQTLAHYLGADTDDTDHRIAVLDRMVREQAFTVLNRLAALLMMEARGQLIESVSKGYQSRGYQLYSKIAGTALGETGQTYRVYLFSLFDELAQELPALFDRYVANGLLFPRETALRALLDEVNHFEIEQLWAEDETIGWIYQYFNSKEERRGMRDASEMPRDSRELAVRNQFFTPRYVVEFLVDNTLGRLWFNATGGQTDLRDLCQYLLAKPDEQPPAAIKLRDPRTLKLLDPACGSMHFGLYAFDLFLEIYREAWAWEQQHGPGSLDVSTNPQAALKPLSQTYEDEAAFARDVPRLIIENNIYGVDIDPRAAQIATLALWLRAQRAWHNKKVIAKDRPRISHGHVVAAVAPPAERELRQQFAVNLDQHDAELFEKTLQLLKGLPEMGVLLQVERELPNLIRQVYVGKGTGLFAEQEQESWERAEARLRVALTAFAEAANSTFQDRLFSQDALQGLLLVDLSRERFDVIVMNPPFGEAAQSTFTYIKDTYQDWANNILCCFIARAFQMLMAGGFIGAIFDRTVTVKSSYENFRRKNLIPYLSSFLDTGWGVLDANVETACACLAFEEQSNAVFLDVRQSDDKQSSALHAVNAWAGKELEHAGDGASTSLDPETLCHLPNAVVGYDFDRFAIDLFDRMQSFEQAGMQARQGHALVSDIHFRTFWEVDAEKSGKPSGHALLYNGSEYSLYVSPDRDVVIKGYDTDFLKSHPSCVLRNPSFQFLPGIGYGKRGEVLDAHLLESERIFTTEGQAIHLEDTEDVYVGLAYLNSPIYQYLINLYCGQHKYSGYLNLLPQLVLTAEHRKIVVEYVSKIIDIKNRWLSCDETTIGYKGFIVSRFSQSCSIGSIFDLIKSEYLSDRKLLQGFEDSIGDILTDSAGLNALEKKKLIDWTERTRPIDPLWPGLDRDNLLELKDSFLASSLISEVVGVLFGRWKTSTSTSASDAGESFIAFQAPVTFSGQFGSFVQWKPRKIFVDDSSATSDLEACFRTVLVSLFGNAAGDIESTLISRMQIQSLRSYFSESGGFFSDHFRRYTKSRREAPIYWPLSTASGSYTLWVYYPSLNNQSLFTAVNDFLDGPNGKLTQVRRECAELRMKGSSRSRDEEKQYETLQTFEQELTELRDTLLKIAPTYQPHHDDGVKITAAPLWQLFRHKPWQKVLKDTWTKLEKGDSDWANLAMAYWPERVRVKCKTDKSLAIAHGLEYLYVEREAAPKKTRGKKKAGADE